MSEDEKYGFECLDCRREILGVSWDHHPGIHICTNQRDEKYPFCPNCGERGEFFDYRDYSNAGADVVSRLSLPRSNASGEMPLEAKEKTRAELGSKALLAFASVGLDPVRERGRVCRGAYIVDRTGVRYLTHGGEWTHGITGDDNWWNNKNDAEDFLKSLKAKPRISTMNESSNECVLEPIVLRSFRVVVNNWPEATSIVKTTSATKARYAAWRSAKEAGYALPFSDLRVRRAPEYDNANLVVGRPHGEDYAKAQNEKDQAR